MRFCKVCDKRASYALPGMFPEYCSAHCTSEMVNVAHKSCACGGDCSKAPSYGFPGEYARFCATHKQPGMIDFKHKLCVFKGCTTVRFSSCTIRVIGHSVRPAAA